MLAQEEFSFAPNNDYADRGHSERVSGSGAVPHGASAGAREALSTRTVSRYPFPKRPLSRTPPTDPEAP